MLCVTCDGLRHLVSGGHIAWAMVINQWHMTDLHHKVGRDRSQQFGAGGMVRGEVKGGREAAWAPTDGTRLLFVTAKLGDVKTTITHPATTTHNRLTDEQKTDAGISAGLIRLSVGHEHIDDLITDLDRALSGVR